MTNKILLTIISILFIGKSVYSQNDFTLHWNAYEAGVTIDENPFNGGFTIKNVGESTIPIYDTIWYGYWIGGAPFDIGLNPDLYSGTVLSGDFEPGDEISISNIIDWPLWDTGIEIEVCAVVYGAGYLSRTGDYFAGDDDISNNKTCLSAILPDYVVGLNEASDESLTMTSIGNKIRIDNSFTEMISGSSLKIYSLAGKELMNKKLDLLVGQNWVDLDFTAKGIYLVHLLYEGEVQIEKFIY